MPRKQSTSRKTGTVQKFIGTAYDEMKTLYDNLDALLNLESGLEYGLRYLGPSDGTPPTTRVDGSPIENGDFYFNTASEALVYFDEADNIWFEVDPAEVLHARDEALAAALAAEESKVGAQTAETGAQTAQASAETAENNAFLSEGEAKLSELAAGISATTAENYATQTGIDASNTAADVVSADTFADNANSSATAAGTHATNANNSATAAALSAQQAEQAFDSFDDKYLGPKDTPPTVDNDGDPLKVGATYYDENDNNLYYWNGAIWESPDKAASDAAQAAASSAASALVSEGNANNSATAALTSETNAASSELAADNSRAAAELAEVGAETSETNAKTSETNAASSETNAKASEDSATASATSAKDDADRAEQFAAGGNGLTKVAHEVSRVLRKREYAGSGFAEWGKHFEGVDFHKINQGMFVNDAGNFYENAGHLLLGETTSPLGASRTEEPIAIVGGVEHTIALVNQTVGNNAKIPFPAAPDGTKSLNPNTGEVHKYHDLAGVGEAYETYSVDFDGSTYIDLTAVPYNMAVGSKVEFKFKTAVSNTFMPILGDSTWATSYLSVGSSNELRFDGFSDVTVNGTPATDASQDIEVGVEYHVIATASNAFTVPYIGDRATDTGTFTFQGEIWDIILEDPTLTAVGIPPRHYLNAEWQAADDAAPDYAVVTDRNGFTTEDWGVVFDSAEDGFVRIPTWTGGSGDTFECMLYRTGSQGGYIVGVDGEASPRIYYAGNTGIIGFNGWSEVTVNGVPASHNVTVLEENTTYHIKGTLAATYDIDVIGKQYNANSAPDARITGVRLTDNTNPENSRHYPLVINSATQPDTLVAEDAAYDKDTAPFYAPDYKASTNNSGVTIPPWSVVAGGASIRFKFRVDNVGEECLLSTSSPQNSYLSLANGLITNFTTINIDGVPYNSGDFTPVAGQEYEFTGDIILNVDLSRIGSLAYSWGNQYGLDGSIWDIELTDNTDPTNSRYYPSLDYRPDGDTSGMVLSVYNPEAPTGEITETADCVSSSSSFYVANGVNTGDSNHCLYGVSIGDTVKVTINSSTGTLGNGIDIGVEYSCTVVYHSEGRSQLQHPLGHTVWLTTGNMTGTNATVVYTANPDTDGTLVNFPAGSEWTLAQVDGVTDGKLENFTVGSEWDNDLVTDGTIVGTTLRTPMTLQDAQKCFLEAKYTDFEPIISRKDLVFLETWREKVVGFVRPFGNVQFGGSSHDGVSLVPVTNFVDQGYSAFGEWDTNTVGEVADWDNMSAEDRAVWANNPKNNLFFDAEDNAYYQECYRVKVIEGLDDEATFVERLADMGYTNQDSADPRLYVHADGSKVIPIALVQRLNQGGYHPTYNPSGCAMIAKDGGSTGTSSNARNWYASDVTPLDTTVDTFTYKMLTTSTRGAIGGTYIARPDQYEYFDAIYAGQVEDLRLNANKQDYARLLTDRVRDGVAGETRGKGKVPFTWAFANTTPTSKGTTGSQIFAALEKGTLPYESEDQTSTGVTVGYFTDATGTMFDCVRFRTNEPSADYIYLSTEHGSDASVIDVTGGCSAIWHNYLSAEYDSLPWVDIIGDPERIAATFPDGVVGQWIDTIPDGAIDNFPLNVKYSGSSTVPVVFTGNDGVSWTSTNANVDTVSNELDYTNFALGNVGLVTYEALSDFTESDDNRAVQGDLGDVWSGMANTVQYGNRLMPSLIDEIGKDTGTASTDVFSVYNPVTQYVLWDNGELPMGNWLPANSPKHIPLGITNPANDSNAVKALPHLVEKDGLLYVQWHATQLVYDASGTVGNEWGDTTAATTYTNAYGEITIVDDESTKTDQNGNTVKVVTHIGQLPIGIANKNQTK